MPFLEALHLLDTSLLYAVQSIQLPFLAEAMLAVTFLGNPIFWIIVAAVLQWSGREHKAFNAMNIVLFAGAITGALKHIAATPRPSAAIFNVIAKDTYIGFSFPSGHTAVIAAAWAYWRKFLDKRAGVLLLIAVPLVAFSRLYLGAHFPSDVIAGAGIGVVAGLGLLWINKETRHAHFVPTKFEDSLAIAGLLAAGLLALSLLKEFPLIAILLGYYVGYFLARELEMDAVAESLAKSLPKLAAGGIGSAAILGAAVLASPNGVLSLQGEVSTAVFVALLFLGFWISFAFPLLWEKVGQKGKQ